MAKPEKRKTRPQGKVITDPRFAKVHTDARFQIFPNKQRKVEIDERFKGMLTEERFQHKAPVDKRGRKVRTERKNEELQRFYRLGDQVQDEHEERHPDSQAEQPTLAKKNKKKQEAWVEMVESPDAMETQAPSEAEDREEGSSEEVESDVNAEADLRWKRMRGLVGPETSSDEEEPDSEAMSDSDFDADDFAEVDDEGAQWGEDGMAAGSVEQIPAGEDSRRLALVSMDWDRIRAVDLLVVLRSFLAKGQRIERVTVYPTVFGQERIAEEAIMGPQIVDTKVQQVAHGSSAEAEDGTDRQSDSDADSDSAPAEFKGRGKEDTGAEVDREALHEYERGRQRYYFALVECDSIATGVHLYKECDELEFELTGNKLDVRFVPDELSFEDRQVRDSATDVPADYEPPPFFTASTAHTNPKLTWDADDDVRRRKLSKRVTADQLREDDFKAYLASGSEDEGEDEEEDEEEVERKRKLLLEGIDAQQPLHRKGGKDWGAAANGHSSADEDDEDGSDENGEEEKGAAGSRKKGSRRGDVDMEVTFGPGLESLEQRMAAKRDSKAARTVWERNEQRIREKKMAAKQKGRHYASSDEEGDGTISEDDLPANDDPFFQHDDSAFDDPFFQGGDEEPEKPLREAERAAKRDKKRKEKAERLAAEKAKETEEQRGKAELELLLLDEHALRDQAVLGGKAAASEKAAGGKPQKMSRKERVKLKKAQKRQERAAGSDDDDLGTGGPAFKANLEDPRFAAIFKDPNFALDPTDPRFIHTAGTAELATAVAKRKKQKIAPEGGAAPVAAVAPLMTANNGQPNSAAELRAMVSSLKNKTAAKSKKRARTKD